LDLGIPRRHALTSRHRPGRMLRLGRHWELSTRCALPYEHCRLEVLWAAILGSRVRVRSENASLLSWGRGKFTLRAIRPSSPEGAAAASVDGSATFWWMRMRDEELIPSGSGTRPLPLLPLLL
jgi:hypothetical protein